MKMVSDCIIEELKYFATDVSIAHDDEQIEAHKMLDASWYRYRHPATDSGILLQIQAICYGVMQSATGSCNLLQGHAIC